MNNQQLFIISGPSGAGEDSILSGLAKKIPLKKAVTTTTRKMRDGEVDGVDYYFVSKDRFKEMIENDELAEWAQHYNDNYYGVTKDELTRIQHGDTIGVWKVDYKGVAHAKKMFPDIVAIFITAESLDILEERIRSRSNVNEAYVQERMAYSREWLDHTDLYDYTVINKQGHLDRAITDVADIICHHLHAKKIPHHIKK